MGRKSVCGGRERGEREITGEIESERGESGKRERVCVWERERIK